MNPHGAAGRRRGTCVNDMYGRDPTWCVGFDGICMIFMLQLLRFGVQGGWGLNTFWDTTKLAVAQEGILLNREPNSKLCGVPQPFASKPPTP